MRNQIIMAALGTLFCVSSAFACKVEPGDRVLDTYTNCGEGTVITVRGPFCMNITVHFDNMDCDTRVVAQGDLEKL